MLLKRKEKNSEGKVGWHITTKTMKPLYRMAVKCIKNRNWATSSALRNLVWDYLTIVLTEWWRWIWRKWRHLAYVIHLDFCFKKIDMTSLLDTDFINLFIWSFCCYLRFAKKQDQIKFPTLAHKTSLLSLILSPCLPTPQKIILILLDDNYFDMGCYSVCCDGWWIKLIWPVARRIEPRRKSKERHGEKEGKIRETPYSCQESKLSEYYW